MQQPDENKLAELMRDLTPPQYQQKPAEISSNFTTPPYDNGKDDYEDSYVVMYEISLPTGENFEVLIHTYDVRVYDAFALQQRRLVRLQQRREGDEAS